MRIYTKTGDLGETGLIGGQRVSKDHMRVEAYGTVDELNSALGIARAQLKHDPFMDSLLTEIQNTLFDMGAEIASPPERAERFAVIDDEKVSTLESAIDTLEEELEPLKQFILPGGSEAAAFLHLARCICRRAERRVATLSTTAPLNGALLRYLNRLSDLLFVMARAANHRAGVADIKWGEPGWKRKSAMGEQK